LTVFEFLLSLYAIVAGLGVSLLVLVMATAVAYAALPIG